MSLIPARPSRRSAAPWRHFWRTALAGAVSLSAVLFALAPAVSAAATSRPARAAIAVTAQIGDRGLAAHAGSLGSEGVMSVPRSGGIVQKACPNGGWDTWVHLYPLEGAFCYGFKGTYPLNGDQDYWYCPGNNKGWITLYNGRNDFRQYFSPGQGLQEMPAYVSEVSITINGWAGTATCPPA
jgi:hypothetical protein